MIPKYYGRQYITNGGSVKHFFADESKKLNESQGEPQVPGQLLKFHSCTVGQFYVRIG